MFNLKKKMSDLDEVKAKIDTAEGKIAGVEQELEWVKELYEYSSAISSNNATKSARETYAEQYNDNQNNPKKIPKIMWLSNDAELRKEKDTLENKLIALRTEKTKLQEKENILLGNQGKF